MKRVFLILVFLVLFIPLSSAAVKINEFVVEPQTDWNSNGNITGSDEWIELYNTGPIEINITGWNLTLNDSSPAIETLNGIILNNSFFILLNPTGSLNLNGQLLLHDSSGVLIDSVAYGNWPDGNTTDNAPTGNSNDINDECLARIPNGADTSADNADFIKTRCTFNSTNIPRIQQDFTIENKTHIPNCTFVTDNLTLQADIVGKNIDKIWFSAIINGVQTNRTATFSSGNTYKIEIPSTELVAQTNMLWNVYANDSYSYLYNNSWITHYINDRTFLTINPPTPNGQNNWYITEPLFTLANSDASDIGYRWNGNFFNYNDTGSFKLEGTPNNGNITGGIHVLKYWSDACSKEPEKSFLGKFDFTNPIITQLQPANNEIVYNNPLPEISAYLDEIYQSNSGIDLTKVKIFVDDIDVTNETNISDADTIDAFIIYASALNLSTDRHNVTINATDNAGRSSQLTWFFTINISAPFTMTIYSPQNISYSSKKVQFNITASQIAEKIEYINYADNNPRWRTFCLDCNEYGFSSKKTKNLKEGWNNVTVKATNEFNIVEQQSLAFFIDSIPPKISKTEPERNKATNGSNFSVKYTEVNPVNIILFWNPNISLQNCTSGTNQYCSTSADLSAFNDSYIDYYFEISDGINTVRSKTTRVFVDTGYPILTLYSPRNLTYENNVLFNMTVSEDVKLEYYDNSDSRPRWRTLCSNCNNYGFSSKKTKRFSDGFHSIIIRAIDKAGNSDEKQISFTVK